jgi:hexosaminidase
MITSSNVTNNPIVLSWNITTNILVSGELDVSFCWKTGANGLDIAWAALDENGVEIDRDTHVGFTGTSPLEPLYILHVPNRRPTATYTLRATVGGRGGTNSNGTIYFPNWN